MVPVPVCTKNITLSYRPGNEGLVEDIYKECTAEIKTRDGWEVGVVCIIRKVNER